MRKVDRLWDWVLPGLISLSPIGAIAYFNACAEEEAPHNEPMRHARHVVAPAALRPVSVVPVARS